MGVFLFLKRPKIQPFHFIIKRVGEIVILFAILEICSIIRTAKEKLFFCVSVTGYRNE